MAKLIILQGGYEAAKAWAETWKQSHMESGVILDEFEDSESTLEAAWLLVESFNKDVAFIVNSVDEIQLLDFSDEEV